MIEAEHWQMPNIQTNICGRSNNIKKCLQDKNNEKTGFQNVKGYLRKIKWVTKKSGLTSKEIFEADLMNMKIRENA